MPIQTALEQFSNFPVSLLYSNITAMYPILFLSAMTRISQSVVTFSSGLAGPLSGGFLISQCSGARTVCHLIKEKGFVG